ncbi:MAG: O-antigen ligase family protein [Chloroflexota bacterium]
MLELLQSASNSPNRYVRLAVTLLICLIAGMVGGALLGYLGPLLTIVLVTAVAIGIMVLRSTQVGLYVLTGVICLLPFATLPIDIGFSPTLLDIAMGAVFFVWAMQIMTHRQGDFMATPIGLPVLVFILLAIATFIAGLAHASLTANILRHFAEIILCISLFFLTVNCVRTRRQLEQLVVVILLAGFCTAAIGIVLYFLPQDLSIRILSTLRVVRYPSGPGVLRYVEDNPDLSLRAISTVVDPNILGGMLILLTGLAIPQLFVRDPLLPRRWISATVATMGLCLILTFSRSSLLGLSIALFVLGVVRYRRLLWALLAAAVLALILPQTQTYIQHFLEGIRGEDLATQMRFGEYKDALILISRYPWFGVGFAGTPDIDTYLGVSSVYLMIAEKMGLIGLLSFITAAGLFFVHTWQAFRRTIRNSGIEAILLGFQTAVLGALLGGTLDHYLFNLDFPHTAAIFWMYIGLGMVAARLTLTADSDGDETKTN